MEWTKEQVIHRLKEIEQKGYISIPKEMYRNDDGVVGQILEREFGVDENNLHIADLGTYELKGMRLKKGRSSKLTLFHQKPSEGMSPLQIFDRFSYVSPSKRDGTLKRKLFTTIYGNRINKRGFILKRSDTDSIDLYYNDEFLASWELSSGEAKIQQVLLAFAETIGKSNTKEEQFHYVKAYILHSPRNIYQAISEGTVVMEFSMDQPANGSRAVHDRGPHFRITVKKLSELFKVVEQVL